MKKHIYAILLVTMLCFVLIGCGKEAPMPTSTPEVEPTSVPTAFETEEPEILATKEPTVDNVPDVTLLEGEWTLIGGFTDGDEYTAEEAGLEGTISFDSDTACMYAHYWSKNPIGEEKSFDSETEYLDTSLYEGCGNEEWCVKLLVSDSDFDSEEEFYVTLIDENTLMLQHFFPFDGATGVGYQTYVRK